MTADGFSKRLASRPAVALILLMSALALAPAAARGERFGDVIVELVSSPPDGISHGNAPYRFRIVNLSPAADRTVTLSMPGVTYTKQIRNISRTVTVGAGQSSHCALWLPPLDDRGASIRVAIDGRWQSNTLNANLITAAAGSHYGVSQFTAVIPQRIPQMNIPTTRVSFSRGELILDTTDSRAPASGQWLDYSPYHLAIVSAEGLATMTAEAVEALMRFAECGGILLVVGHYRPYGPASEMRNSAHSIVYYPRGFGRIAVMHLPSETSFEITRRLLEELGPLLAEMAFLSNRNARPPSPRHYYHSHSPSHRPLTEFRAIEDTQPPVQFLFLAMIGFVILIGPVNLIVLARLNRRLWMLWTVPALSALASASIFGLTILNEGLHTRTRLTAFTILDQRTSRAVTIGRLAYYSPFPPRGGLTFDYDTELTPIDFGLGPVTVDWTTGQHLSSGWLASRVPLQLNVRRNESRRERIVVRGDSQSGYVAVNGLGVPLVRLVFADPLGNMWQATSVAAGQEVKLTSMQAKAAGQPGALRRLMTQSAWESIPQTVNADPGKYLFPGAWLAITDESPFLNEGIGRVRERRVEAAILGIVDPMGEEAQAWK